MEVLRKYKRLDWFDFLDAIEIELSKNPGKEVYFDFLDELKMRQVECISEGALFKFKKVARNLLKKFEKRYESLDFASSEDYSLFKEIAESIYS